MEIYVKTIIIGAGAAGLMAAYSAAKKGNKVIVLEHKQESGRKLKATGNGKCNFCNELYKREFFNSQNPGFSNYCLEAINVNCVKDIFAEMGMKICSKEGYLYPYSQCGADVVSLMVNSCICLGVEFLYECEVKGIIKEEQQDIKDSKVLVEYIRKGVRQRLEADNVIVAAGSKAYPKTGSDGSGYYFAKKLGHNIIEPLPALTGIYASEAYVTALAGLRWHCAVSSYIIKEGCEQLLQKDKGEVQFTSYGLSGIPVFQLSSRIGRELYNGNKIAVYLDLLPDDSRAELMDLFKGRIEHNKEITLENVLCTILHKKLIDMILNVLKIKPNVSISSIKNKENILEQLVELIKGLRYNITATNDFDNAQVCSGGVDTREIDNKTMESKLVKKVYFVGEVLDVDGICGGYNLHWAWSSGYVAGLACAVEEQ